VLQFQYEKSRFILVDYGIKVKEKDKTKAKEKADTRTSVPLEGKQIKI
jgi:hypothetical protein